MSAEEYERVVGFADTYGTRATVSVYVDDEEPSIQFSVLAGMSGGRGFPTPEACRQLAAALLDAADRVEGASA